MKILFAGKHDWVTIRLVNPSLYILSLWHMDTIDKGDPSIWVDLKEVTDATHDL